MLHVKVLAQWTRSERVVNCLSLWWRGKGRWDYDGGKTNKRL